MKKNLIGKWDFFLAFFPSSSPKRRSTRSAASLLRLWINVAVLVEKFSLILS